MAQAVTDLKVLVKVAGHQGLNKLGRQLDSVGKDVAKANFNFDRFTKVLKAKQRQQTKNINNTRAFANSWRELANSLKIGSREFNIATRNAQRLERQLNRTSAAGKRLSMGGIARTLGAVAGSAVFGGPEGAVGALIGGAIGGPGAALVGGAFGAQLGMLRKQAGQIAENVAAFRGYQIALAGISKDQADYVESIKAMDSISRRFLIPQKDAIRQFTKLKASIVGAGYTTKETKTVFEGMAAAILATGGSTHDLNSALVAAAQVFSKGKVSAEELRQQIGERLPGAFTIFADAMGISTKELDKMLERGEVDLSNFVTFSEDIFERYKEIADTLAASPERAGQRLAVALSMAEIKFGGFFQVVGAGFQNWATNLVNWGLDNEEQLKENIAKFAVFGEDVVYIMKEVAINILEAFGPVFKWIGNTLKALTKEIRTDLLEGQFKELARLQPGYKKWGRDRDRPILELRQKVHAEGFRGEAFNEEYRRQMRVRIAQMLGLPPEGEVQKFVEDYEQRVKNMREKLFSLPGLKYGTANKPGGEKGDEKTQPTIWDGMKAGVESYGKTVDDVMTNVAKATAGAFQKMEDALVDFVMTGTFKFRDFARSILREMARIAIQQAIMAPLKTWFGSLFAKGGVFAQNGIVPFSKGGIVNSPQLFPFKDGIGLMGEAGPEAVMPLRRGPGGRLGVEASGGGTTNISVSVDASGSSVEGDEQQSQQLGEMLAAAIQSELVNQQRPGGLLA